jgi:hypothetical protein
MADTGPKAPGDEVFSEADLAPAEWQVRAKRRARIDRGAAAVAVIALGAWLGGLVALGACAAPMVFSLTPYPFSADAMGAAFARFDRIAIGCALVALGSEVVRSVLDFKRTAGSALRAIARARRYLGIVAALLAIYSATQLTPEIVRLHRAGIRRHVGPDGEHLERVHRRAELIGKAIVPLAALVIALHVATVRSARDEEEEEEEEEAPAPFAPGPRSSAGATPSVTTRQTPP